MTYGINASLTGDDGGRRPHRLLLVCATVLTAAVVVSVAGWQFREHGKAAPTQPGSTIAAARAHADSPVMRAARSSRFLYLVSSGEEATLLQYMISEELAHRYHIGEQSVTDSVLVTEGLDAFAIGFLTSLQPDQVVVDLRRP